MIVTAIVNNVEIKSGNVATFSFTNCNLIIVLKTYLIDSLIKLSYKYTFWGLLLIQHVSRTSEVNMIEKYLIIIWMILIRSSKQLVFQFEKKHCFIHWCSITVYTHFKRFTRRFSNTLFYEFNGKYLSFVGAIHLLRNWGLFVCDPKLLCLLQERFKACHGINNTIIFENNQNERNQLSRFYCLSSRSLFVGYLWFFCRLAFYRDPRKIFHATSDEIFKKLS